MWREQRASWWMMMIIQSKKISHILLFILPHSLVFALLFAATVKWSELIYFFCLLSKFTRTDWGWKWLFRERTIQKNCLRKMCNNDFTTERGERRDVWDDFEYTTFIWMMSVWEISRLIINQFPSSWVKLKQLKITHFVH
jgi:hypothetical protein